jgi:CMP-N,N'-diacetyllegionaminic acid synthase
MSSKSKIIAVIPARGGSKSVPRKNLHPLGGKPLITWSIDLAKRVREIDRIIVSTDDQEIASIAQKNEAEVYRRPAALATDTALVIDALKDLLSRLSEEGDFPEWTMLLEPTCPLRSPEDVRSCINLSASGDYDSIATFKTAELNPHRAWKIEAGVPQVFIPGAIPWLPRQAQPAAYQLNGAVYLFRSAMLEPESRSILPGRIGGVIMPKERSYDIDDPIDFTIVEAILKGEK